MKKARIMLALTDKLQCRKNEAKIKRLEKGIEVAKANAEEQLATAEDTLDTLVQNFDVDTDVPSFIKSISVALYDKDNAKTAIAQLERIHEYLFEELDVPEEKE